MQIPSLRILILRAAHEGRWQCEAKNSVGSATGDVINLDVKRKSFYPPLDGYISYIIGHDMISYGMI